MRSNKRHLYGLIASLVFIGLATFCYRHFILEVPLADKEVVNSWMIEANLHFNTNAHSPVKASFMIPYLPRDYAILDEYFVSHHYGVTTNLVDFNRQTVWSIRRANGPQSLYYRAILRETDTNESILPKPHAIKKEILDENQANAVEYLSNLVRESSADIQTFAQEVVKELNKKEGNARLLIGSEATETNLIKAEIKILNQAHINAMQVQGINLAQHNNKATLIPYLMVYTGRNWIYINPKTGSTGFPEHFLVWQYGSEPIYELSGGKNPFFTLTVSPAPLNALSVAKSRGLQTNSQLMRFSLLQLPVHLQETYKILLTVPLGAFVILILRNFIGLKTFGTFMPVLIALAFRETHVIWGICLFTTIVFFGLLARFYLDQLRLLLVPRLAAILTIVILLMIVISVLSQNLNFEKGLSVALFPMVILTMTIERMCITWDERGASESIRAGIGSLIAATIAFTAMNYEPIQYLLFAFPELLLLLLALTLWFGQYRGYRVTELMRFKSFSGRK